MRILPPFEQSFRFAMRTTWLILVCPLLCHQVSAQSLLDGQRIAVLEKEEVPGVGVLDAPGEPVLGMGGHIGFAARVSGIGKAVFVGKPGQWKCIAMEGKSFPGGAEGMTHRLAFVKLWVNSVGRATLQTDAEWKDQPLAQRWPRTLFSTDANGGLQPLAVQWMPMPQSAEGLVSDRIDPFSAYGWTVWRTHPKRGPDTPQNSSAILAAKDGEVEVLLRTGIRPNGINDPKAKLNDVAGSDLGMAGNGMTVQKASISDAEEAGTSNLLIGMIPGRGHHVLIRSGLPSPAAPWIFDNFNHPSPDDHGAILFRAQLRKPGSYDSLTAFFRRDAEGEIHPVLRGGEPAPGTAGKTFKQTMGGARGWSSPKNGFALIQADIEGAERGMGRGWWLWSAETGKLEPIAIPGDSAPGFKSGVTIKEIKQIAVNSAGQVAFLAKLEGRSGDEGLWAGKPGSFQLIAIEGGQVELGGESYEMGGLRFAGGRIAGQGAALNDAGQIAYGVHLKNKGHAILLAQIQE